MNRETFGFLILISFQLVFLNWKMNHIEVLQTSIGNSLFVCIYLR